VLAGIAGVMPADGLLYLGGAETVLGLTTRFAPLPAERGVYGVAAPAAVAPAGRVAATV
jgi:chemotaxis protein methyltransferase CheR